MAKLELKPLLDDEAAAPLIGVTAKTLANWRVLGKGPVFVRSSRKPKYHPDDIADWVNARRVQSTSEQIAA